MFPYLLNIKSPYNFLSSTIKNEDYFDFAKKNSLPAVFQIDTNNMHNALNFFADARKHKLKPVIGVELEFNFVNIIIIPKNNDGYKELTKLFYEYNVLKNHNDVFKNVIKNNSNLILILKPILNEWENNLKIEIKDNIFIGVTHENNFYLNANHYQNMVYAGAVNCLKYDDIKYLKALIAIRDQKKFFEDIDFKKDLYLDESHLDLIIKTELNNKNILSIISQIDDDVIKDEKPEMVNFENSFDISSKNYLRKLCEDSLNNFENEKILSDNINVYKERLDHELSVIFEMGFENYFLVVSDFVGYAKSKKIFVGPGRGSASGSLVSFLLKITEVDPIKYDLLFERFLNHKRVTMPDIDIDFQDDRRFEILEYLNNKYKNKFALISTFQKMGVKNSIRDVAKILDIAESEINPVLKLISGTVENFSEKLFEENAALKHLRDIHKDLFDIANFVNGLPRQLGTHAAGIIISNVDLYEKVPLTTSATGMNQVEYDAKKLEKIGLIKIDILGLRNLSVINNILEQIKISRNININLHDLSLEDNDTYTLLKNGDTSSIFQFESRGMIDTLKKVKPANLIDLASVMALFRPGPQEFIPDFVKRKNEHSKVISVIDSESVKEILKETYGVIVYQEQVMKILQSYANFSLSKSDLVRAAISKKNETVMKEFKIDFINGAVENNKNKEEANKIWDYIEKFANYGFNKSHAIAYSTISYWMAYLKCHYKAEFYCSILNTSIKDNAKAVSIINDFRKKGGKVLGPSILRPISKYIVNKGIINMPLTVIKNVSSMIVENIKLSLKNKQEILSDKNNLFGVMQLVYGEFISKEIFANIIKAGVFDFYGVSRKNLLKYDLEILTLLQQVKLTGDINHFNLDVIDKNIIDTELDIEEFEKDSIGFSVNANVIAKMRKENEDINLVKIVDIDSNFNALNIIGKVGNVSVITDKNNNEMAFIEFYDETGEISVTIFSTQYKQIEHDLKINNYYVLNINAQVNDGTRKSTLNKVVKKEINLKS